MGEWEGRKGEKRNMERVDENQEIRDRNASIV